MRAAYHQAAHVVAANVAGITVDSVSVVEIQGEPPGVRMTPIDEFIRQASTPLPVVDPTHDYVVTKLAGQVAEMILCAQWHRAQGQTVNWSRWRARWQKRLIREDDPDVDFAYAALFAWIDVENHPGLEQQFQTQWRQTENLLNLPQSWAKVERLAAELLEKDVLTGAEALQIIRSTS